MRSKNKNFEIPDINFYQQRATKLAQDLLSCALYFEKFKRFFRIVETEAYTDDDPASHSFKGLSNRNRSMFLQGGHLYVYRIYGVHYCMNIVSGQQGVGEAVLIRSLVEIDSGRLIVGPGRVCRELDISAALDGIFLPCNEQIRVYRLCEVDKVQEIKVTPRIGITKGQDLLRRYFVSSFEKSLPKPR